MVIQRDRRERRNIDHKLLITCNMLRQLGVKRVNSLNNQHAFFIHYKTAIPELSFSGHKIVRWQFNLFLIEQGYYLIFEKFQIDSV
ncbi:hypothetical protein SDC9_181999 [bioreactor metagenome]|uniref:Uncharacterized protein n=1 Tax=bioreactor metagenome TaxID=1076179 RepID=A0A645H697_9ZZZZ